MEELKESEVQEVQTVNNNTTKEVFECKSAQNLRIVGKCILALAIISGIILFATNATVADYWGDKSFNPMSLVYLICPILSSVVIWAFANAVADNTENIQKMANKGEK